MSIAARSLLAIVVALLVGFGLRFYGIERGAEREVSPAEIAAAKAAGKPGYEMRPGSVAALPARSETADILPFKWVGAGIAAGVLLFVAARHVAR